MKTLLDLGLTSAESAQVLRGVHEGAFHLLLGAGASYGCSGGNDVPLKDGASVSQRICRDFDLNLNADEAKRLPLAYEEAQGKDHNKLRRWLRDHFTGCTSTWQSALFRFGWQRIWTFNIDDVLAHAFLADTEHNLASRLEEFDWKQRVTPLTETVGAQQLIYLHGRAVDMGTPNEGLIFSTGEYAAATKAAQQWHASFQTHYLEHPFIVCGASLAEEVDIAEAIRSKNHSHATLGIPSLMVSFSLDEGQKDRMRRYNLIPVVCPLDEFFQVLASDYAEFKKTADVTSDQLPPGYFGRFLSQFRRLDVIDTSAAAIAGTDFYGGDEPIWSDILNGRDAAFVSTAVVERLMAQSTDPFAILVHGHPVTGKTTTLLRAAHAASMAGMRAFWFRHEEGLNAKVAAAYLAVDENAVLFIDDAADHTEAVGEILRICKQDKKPARIVLSARTKRQRGFRMDIADKFRREVVMGPLKNDDLFKLIQKRRKASRLGHHVAKKDTPIVRELQRVCKSELLSCVSHIEFSEPLRQRVRKLLLSAVRSPIDKDFIAKIACVHRFGFSLPIRAALMSSGLAFDDFKHVLDNHLMAEGPVVRDERGIRLRHRILSEYAWSDYLNVDERYTAMSAVVNALAPLINPAVIRAKMVEHLIIREVLDQEQVSRSIGPRALEFYEAHEDLLGWSSRYWDQRALLESRIEGHFPKAYSYSQKAISLERHAFAYTSFGSICMTHALRIYDQDPMNAMKYFMEGEEALTTACDLADRQGMAHEHPYVKFFSSAQLLLRKMKPADTEFGMVLQHYDIWLHRAGASKIFTSAHGAHRLQDVRGSLIKARLRAVG